jgi:pSer/pThr/pTyr-binding forkhead associated (FHA) protein
MAEVKNICLEALERHCERGDVGRLDLTHGTYEGQIFLAGSRIIHAAISGLEGIPALFRLFDWGDAETLWNSDLAPEKPTLNLTMDEASTLYAENLSDRAEIEARAKERIDEAFSAPEAIAGQAGGIESVLKHYTISLECSDPALLPGGFVFSDATKNSFVIGSSEDADVVLKNPSIDPLHCGVMIERGSVLVWDLGAQSGVKLNGQPIQQDILKVGDKMSLGNLELRVRFQLRRPTIKVKLAPTAPGATPAATPAAIPPTGTMPMPKITAPPSKEVPKGPITFAKVEKELRQGTDKSLLGKIGSLFGKKK